jgi:oxygen-independent coproporphyrinogen-3 oxidase
MAGLYVHIPFCIKKCAYCDFLSFADHSRMMDYNTSLKTELRERACGQRIDTVFFGGGTPSVLPLGIIAELVDVINANYCIAPDAERTIELNPGTADTQKLEEYKYARFNRLSIGVQSLDDGLLVSIGRVHDSASFYNTFDMARKAGFDNINTDIIYALPARALRRILIP